MTRKSERMRLLDARLIEAIREMDDDAVLAVHDLTHEVMDERHGKKAVEGVRRAAQAARKE